MEANKVVKTFSDKSIQVYIMQKQQEGFASALVRSPTMKVMRDNSDSTFSIKAMNMALMGDLPPEPQ